MRVPFECRPGRAVAAAAALVAGLVAAPCHAGVVTSGTVSLRDVFTGAALDLVDGADARDGRLGVGGRTFASGQLRYVPGTLEVSSAGMLRVAYLDAWGDSVATTRVLIDGAGSRVELVAPGSVNRFGLGNAAGKAGLTVSGGAVLDGAAQVERCEGGSACQNVIGAAAGGHGVLTVTGAGSQARFARMFHVAEMNYNAPVGRPGEDTRGEVYVRDGALLSTELPSLGGVSNGSNLLGTERSFALVSVSDPGSLWQIGASPFVGGAVRLHAAIAPRSRADISVLQGGQVEMLATPGGAETQLALGTGGDFNATVSGAGSSWRVTGSADSGWMQLANGGYGVLRIDDGARFEAPLRDVQIGLNGGSGVFIVERGGVAALATAAVGVGTSGGWGQLAVGNGSRLEAGRVVIGSQGVLAGSGELDVSEVVVLAGGLVSPGQSPGSLRLNGAFRAEAGSRLLLEVESDGRGGFDIDQLLFDQMPDLNGLDIEFHFLGSTDPLAFLQSGGFEIDRFIQVDGAGLGDDAFDKVGFSARADAWRIENFSFSATTGAAFSAVAIPIPATGALLAAGVAALALRRRRR